MALYLLRSTWRLLDGRGVVMTNARLKADTTEEAIALAKAEPEPDLPVRLQTMHLMDASGRVLWSLRGPASDHAQG
jgi:hypothetical protein